MTVAKKVKAKKPPTIDELQALVEKLKERPRSRFTGKGRSRGGTTGEMNSLEKAYAEELERLRREGWLERWDFHPESLRLAPGLLFTPDFRVLWSDGEVRFYETKGYKDDRAANLRLKLAAYLHPYRFFRVTRAFKRDGGAWLSEEIYPS